MSQLLECFRLDYHANTFQCSGVMLQKKQWLTFKMCQTSAYWKEILSLFFVILNLSLSLKSSIL